MRPRGRWLRLIALGWAGAAWLGLEGCSREQPPQAAEPVSGAAPTEAPEDVPADLPAADSGLSIKRGVMSVSKDGSTFRLCTESSELWLLDQSDGSLSRAFDPELQAGSLELYVEAYGERVPVADDIPAAREYAGMFVLEEALYASRNTAERGCDEPSPDYVVAARGNEPFWSVEVSESQMVWRSPEEPKEITLDAAPAQDAEGAVRYHASGEGHELELLLDSQACRDSMSGDFFAYAARAVLNGEEFRGCARVGK